MKRISARARTSKKAFYGVCIIMILLIQPCFAESFTTECSYYTRASCMKESGQAVMANGKELNDEALTGASWDFKLGSWVKVRNIRNNREVVLQITDRGPARRLYRKNRRLDVSLESAERLGFVKNGLAIVTVEKVGG